MPVPVPRFVAGPGGPLFTVNWAPPGKARGTILCVPPFAEEMNRCRRTLAEFCMQAAGGNWSAWQFDLLGTGDSGGDFVDARWEGWVSDLDFMAGRVAGSGPLVIVAMRAGALLAAQWLARGGRCDQLVLWQPVASGRLHLQQFLRLRVMASRFEGVNESVNDLLEELGKKGEVEVAGYRLPKAVAEGLQAAELSCAVPAGTPRVTVLEAGPAEPAAPGKPLARVLEAWREAGIACHWKGVRDEQCWASQETTVSRRMIEATLDLLQADGVASPGRVKQA